MLCFIIFGLLLVIGIALCVICGCFDSEAAGWIGFILIMLSVLFLVPCAVMWGRNLSYPAEHQAIYEFYKTHKPASALEDIQITQAKVERNARLASAQFYKKNYPGWSLYPDAVLDLKPIE